MRVLSDITTNDGYISVAKFFGKAVVDVLGHLEVGEDGSFTRFAVDYVQFMDGSSAMLDGSDEQAYVLLPTEEQSEELHALNDEATPDGPQYLEVTSVTSSVPDNKMTLVWNDTQTADAVDHLRFFTSSVWLSNDTPIAFDYLIEQPTNDGAEVRCYRSKPTGPHTAHISYEGTVPRDRLAEGYIWQVDLVPNDNPDNAK